MALDDATKALVGQLAAAGGPPMHETEPAEARAKMAALLRFYPPGPELPRVEQQTVEASGQRVLVLGPDNPRGIIVWWHGGGWVVGSPEEHEAVGRALAAATGCTVVLPGYRLAPEDRFPAALEDSLDALGWVLANRAELAGADAPVIIGGDSAGGNLATIVARHALEFRAPIAAQVLVYPSVDHDFDNESYRDQGNHLALNRDTMNWFWDHYVDPEDRSHPDVSPARADDLSGLPETIFVAAEHDVLTTEGLAYADALRAADVPVTYRLFEGQMHGFFQMTGLLPGSAAAVEWIAEQLNPILVKAGR